MRHYAVLSAIRRQVDPDNEGAYVLITATAPFLSGFFLLRACNCLLGVLLTKKRQAVLLFFGGCVYSNLQYFASCAVAMAQSGPLQAGRLPRQEHPDSIHICAVVVEYETLSGRMNYGVATNWLKNKIPVPENGDAPQPKVPVYVRKYVC